MSTPFAGSSTSTVSRRFIQLVEREAPQPAPDVSDFDYLARHFGRSLLNVSPRHLERLKVALENDDSETIAELMGTHETGDKADSDEPESITIEFSLESFFKAAVEDYKTEWIEYFLQIIIEKSIPFYTGASMIQKNFKNLWIDYKTSLDPMLKKDVLGWDVCTIKVPVEAFTSESNIGARVGTCNTIEEWIQSSRQGTVYEHWTQLNPKGVGKLLEKSRGRIVNATVRIFCFANGCKSGTYGIMRFLLMHKAPASAFRASLIRWIIVYKWEKIWKVRAFKSLAFYLFFFVVLNTFVIALAFELITVNYTYPRRGQNYVATITALLGVFGIFTLWREFFQLKRYIKDCRELFPTSYFRGIKHYLGSRQNQIDVTLSIIILVFFPLFCSNMRRDYSDKISAEATFSMLAFVVLLMWAKALYLAQAFKRTGIFVLMIGRVLRECLPYFFMLVGFMIGFGFTMYIALLDILQEISSKSDWECYPEFYPYFSHYYYYHNYSDFYFPENPHSYICDNYSEYMYCTDKKHFLKESFFERYHYCTSKIEDDNKILESFSTPLQSVLTMAYAMVGLFDPEVLFKCDNSSYLVIVIFVLYLALQTIVMFNMLIAAMGDAFDGVRAAEEESFMMARAEFIDQYEASIRDEEIKAIDKKIGKYLYVLIPEDKVLEKCVPFWKGRMTTIKEDVRKIVLDAHEDITQKMDQLTQKVDQQIGNEHQSTQNMNQLTQNISEMFAALKSDVQSFRSEIRSLEEKITMLEK